MCDMDDAEMERQEAINSLILSWGATRCHISGNIFHSVRVSQRGTVSLVRTPLFISRSGYKKQGYPDLVVARLCVVKSFDIDWSAYARLGGIEQLVSEEYCLTAYLGEGNCARQISVGEYIPVRYYLTDFDSGDLSCTCRPAGSFMVDWSAYAM